MLWSHLNRTRPFIHLRRIKHAPSIPSTTTTTATTTPIPKFAFSTTASSHSTSSESEVIPKPPTKTKLKFSNMPKTAKLSPLSPSPAIINPIKPEQIDPLYGQLSPLMQHVRDTMNANPKHVVLTQVGSFFELYFEHATEYAAKLSMQLTAKKFKGGVSIPFTGFPLGSLERYLRILVGELGEGVVIMEQVTPDGAVGGVSGGMEVSRKVTRIISPGTLIDESFLNSQINNFLLCLDFPSKLFDRSPDLDSSVGLSWVDLSIGSVYVQEVKLGSLIAAVTRIKPVEVLIHDDFEKYKIHEGEWWDELKTLKKYYLRYCQLPSRHQTIDSYYHMFSNHTKLKLDSHFDDFTQKEVAALRTLLAYTQQHLPDSDVKLSIPEKTQSSEIMEIDARTAEALELHRTYRDQFVRGSLISTIRRTVTDAGSRLLTQWISSPSTKIEEIQRRQQIVTVFVIDASFRNDIVSRLKDVYDISRIVQRFSLGRGTPLDLILLAKAIGKVDEVRLILEDHVKVEKKSDVKKTLMPLVNKLESQSELAEEILRDLDEEVLMKVSKVERENLEVEINPNVIKEKDPQENDELMDSSDFAVVSPDATPALKKLHMEISTHLKEKQQLEALLHSSLVLTGAVKEASLKYAPNLSYQVYFRGTKNSDFNAITDLFPDIHYTQRNQTTRWGNLPQWTDLGAKIDALKYRIKIEENEVIKLLRAKVIENGVKLRDIAKVIDELDVTTSLATLAHEKNLVMPVIDTSSDLEIHQGRHLVVESHLSRTLKQFTPNDTTLSSSSNTAIQIITGPNMGGKSTYLRQVALIVLLSHIGSYVPVQFARIGICDKILTRVGSADDLSNGQSTFMVEMLETGYILRHATDKSLAILDEVGRGTGVSEGIAVAFGTVKGLMNRGGRCLFATHFGREIKSLFVKDGGVDGVVFKKTEMVVRDGKVRFEHTLSDGVSLNSGALDVAKLAGFPEDALYFAEDALKSIEGFDNNGKSTL